MKAKPDCTVCLMNQYLQIARMCGADEETIKDGFYEFLREIPEFIFTMSPPETAAYMTSKVRQMTGIKDPYKKIKDLSNKLALDLYPALKKRINEAADPFAEALCLAIAGNLIDFGAKADLDLDSAIEEILDKPFFRELTVGETEEDELFQYSFFYESVAKADRILYLGDNAGEIVFDRLFIEEIKKEFPEKEIIFVVRGGPALNDVLPEDACDCGLDESAEIISSGCAAAGTVLDKCSGEFLRAMNSADLIISKGQGNFESLSEEVLPQTFFLFRVKCQPVSKAVDGEEGRLVLKSSVKVLQKCSDC